MLKYIFMIALLLSSQAIAQDKTDLILLEIKSIKEDIKVLREDMNKRFEQVDKRFESMHYSMDKRFEQVDKRLDFMQNILYALMGLIFASPFVALYLRDKREAEERKNFDQFKG
jgi:tetrahydromethanopterin S-methyltransferase subunit B